MLSTVLSRFVGVSILALATCWPGAVSAAPADAGAAVVVQLYKDFAWQAFGSDQDQFGEGLARQSKAVLEKYFDPALVTLLERDATCQERVHGICNLDIDILFASQDPRVTDLVVKHIAPGKVAVEFTDPVNEHRTRLEFRLALAGAKWKITDIIYRTSGDSSLKKILLRKIR